MKTGILFDLDGTLLNTLEDLTDSVNYTLRCYHCPERSPMEIRRFLGNGAKNLIERSLPADADDTLRAEAFATYLAYYAQHNQIKTRPYDGILEALAELGKEYPIAVVSNKSDHNVKALCAEHFGSGIYALGATDDCPHKPAPDMLYKGMTAIGVEKCIYVGDSEVDILVAKNAGVPCLSVLWGFRDEALLRESGGAHFCRDPKKLAKILKEMIENGQ